MAGKRPTPITNQSLTMPPFGAAFGHGFSGKGAKGITLIPKEQMAEQLELLKAEEKAWWKGRRATAQLIVELPFWLMVPEGKLTLTYGKTSVTATIRSGGVETQDGPSYLGSHNSVIYIGTDKATTETEYPNLTPPTGYVVNRILRTIVIFDVKMMRDVFSAWNQRHEVLAEDHTGVRRVNRAFHYLTTLGFAHIPFLNRLIASYRSRTHDPYAFAVSEWDVPVWYAKSGMTVIPIHLMEYWSNDIPPGLSRRSKGDDFHVATIEQLQSRALSPATPGHMELLDANSLMYRGRFEDAIRSVVTAIEVALEDAIASALNAKGKPAAAIQERLAKTQDSFFERLLDFEDLTQQRIPGPILNGFPHINGLRFRSELDWVRTLRHKIVHEGMRVDITQRGRVQRAIDTMTWLFYWLAPNDCFGPDNTRGQTFFSMLRGQVHYRFVYRKSEVKVLPHEREGDVPLREHALYAQYLRSTDRDRFDIELFCRMSFEYLGCRSTEGPPEPRMEPKLRERYVLQDGRRKALVYCLQFDGDADSQSVGAVVTRSIEAKRHYKGKRHTLIVIGDQKASDKTKRKLDGGIPADVLRVINACGFTAITALDLQLLVRGCLELGWPASQVRELLFTPGRQGACPPSGKRIGVHRKSFPKQSAISIVLDKNKTVSVGDRLTMLAGLRFVEERITSLQVDGKQVEKAKGPCNVGVTVSQDVSIFTPGQQIFRLPPKP